MMHQALRTQGWFLRHSSLWVVYLTTLLISLFALYIFSGLSETREQARATARFQLEDVTRLLLPIAIESAQKDEPVQALSDFTRDPQVAVTATSSSGVVVTWHNGRRIQAPLLPALNWGETLAESAIHGMTPAIVATASQHDQVSGVTWTVDVAELESRGLAQYENAKSSGMAALVMAGACIAVVAGAAALTLRRVQRSERQLLTQSRTDALTGLPNRMAFNEALAGHSRTHESSGQRFSLLFIDLDNFKYVNDNLGHDAGDELLQAVASRLTLPCCPTAKAYRLGGDEFVVVTIEDDAAPPTERIAQQLLSQLCGPLQLKGTEMVIQASVGGATMGVDASTPSALLKCADLALYAAKERGKCCFVAYTPELAQAGKAFAQLTQELASALSNDELFVAYQQKFDLPSRDAVGFEALLRWSHPQRGLLVAADFVPVAESTGLMGALGQFVMAQVVEQVRAWYDAGLGWQHVSVNLSAVQLRDSRAKEHLAKMLTQFKVPAGCIGLELAESSIQYNKKEALARIAEFRDLGVSISVDDFGAGALPLPSMRELGIESIKVAQSFVQNCLVDAGQLEICKVIVGLGKSLGLRVIAEGVESEGQALMMTELGCNLAQGFHLGRPLTSTQATQALLALARQEPSAEGEVSLW